MLYICILAIGGPIGSKIKFDEVNDSASRSISLVPRPKRGKSSLVPIVCACAKVYLKICNRIRPGSYSKLYVLSIRNQFSHMAHVHVTDNFTVDIRMCIQ